MNQPETIKRNKTAKSKYVAKGSYGCVVSPALPNSVNGTWKEYPTNISKLFFRKNNYNSALNKQKRVYNLTKNKGHQIFPYDFKNYKWRNLSNANQKSCIGNSKIRPENDVYPVRMPNLGVDIFTLLKNPDAAKELLKVPIPTLFEQIQKVMEQVHNLNQVQKLNHGDIRETNIMIDPKTGVLTLIDFDFLLPFDEFFQKYRDYGFFGFYNNPPESFIYYFLDLIGEYIEHKMAGMPVPEIYKKLGPVIVNYITKNQSIFRDYIQRQNKFFRDSNGIHLTTNELFNSLLFNIQYIGDYTLEYVVQNQINEINEVIIWYVYRFILSQTIDSYGLGFSFLILISQVYGAEVLRGNAGLQKLAELYGSVGKTYTSEELLIILNSLRELYNEVLLPMIQSNISDRILLEPALETIKTIDVSSLKKNIINSKPITRRNYPALPRSPINNTRKTKRHKTI